MTRRVQTDKTAKVKMVGAKPNLLSVDIQGEKSKSFLESELVRLQKFLDLSDPTHKKYDANTTKLTPAERAKTESIIVEIKNSLDALEQNDVVPISGKVLSTSESSDYDSMKKSGKNKLERAADILLERLGRFVRGETIQTTHVANNITKAENLIAENPGFTELEEIVKKAKTKMEKMSAESEKEHNIRLQGYKKTAKELRDNLKTDPRTIRDKEKRDAIAAGIKAEKNAKQLKEAEKLLSSKSDKTVKMRILKDGTVEVGKRILVEDKKTGKYKPKFVYTKIEVEKE